jgi:hypothetical protein
VCGSCLWYAESGERLCPAHAAEYQSQGRPVIPPERYAHGIAHSEGSAARPLGRDVPYRGNSIDVTALLAAAAGVMALASCAGLAWVIPMLAVVFGLIAWLQSNDAINARRARWLSLLGIAGGGLFVVFFIGLFAMMFLCFALQFFLISQAGTSFPTPIP